MTLKLIRINRLKQLQVERGAQGPVELGKLIGRRANQTSDLLHGRKAFGEKIARSIEESAGLPQGWLDDPGVPDSQLSSAKTAPRNVPEEAVAVPLLRDLATREHSEVLVPPMFLSKTWVSRLSLSAGPENLRFFHVSDDGMQPTFSNGDALLVDIGVRELTRDGVHLIRAHERTHLRRLRLRLDGAVEVSEDSPTARSVEIVAITRLKITGRVVWAWAGRPI